MPFEPRLFTLAKDADHPGENQDACCVDPRRGRAAVADGVATSIFARRWAELLAEAALAGPPDPGQREAFAAWLAALRQRWAEAIDESRLAWFQKPKMKQGAFSTLLWTWIDDAPPGDQDGPSPAPGVSQVLHAVAIGDCCLLHVRQGQVLRTFPIQKSAELEADPLALGSLDLGRDAALEFHRLEAPCAPGDLIVLSTDAVAGWLLQCLEAGEPVAWDDLAAMTEDAWRREVCRLRESGRMRYDDATLAVLRVVQTPAEAAPEGISTLPAAPAPPPPEEVSPLPTPDSPLPTPHTATPPPLPPEEPIELDLPPAEPQPDWKTRLKTLSEEFAQQVGQQISRGLEQLKKAKHSADEALRRYRDKRRPRDPKDRGE